MKLFDIFDDNGSKIGEVHEADGGNFGCFGFFLIIIGTVFLFGGGIVSWWSFFKGEFYRNYLVQVLFTMIIVLISVITLIWNSKRTVATILYSIFIGAGTLGILSLLSSESFFAGLLLGMWLSMGPATLFTLLLQPLVIYFKRSKNGK